MRDAALRERRAAAGVDDRLHVARAHDLLVVDRDVFEERQQVDFLLVLRAEKIVIRLTGDREHRRAIHLGVVQSVEEMDRARTRRRETDAKLPRVFCVAARHERRGFFVADLDERQTILPLTQRLHDSVDAVAGQSEDDAHTPVNQTIREHISSGT